MLAEFIRMLWMSQFALARSLCTKCIEEDEVGKSFSAIAFLAALIPMLSSPTFRCVKVDLFKECVCTFKFLSRTLYDSTIETFPSAFMLLGAAIALVLTALNFVVYTQRRNMLVDRKGKRIANAVARTQEDEVEVSKL